MFRTQILKRKPSPRFPFTLPGSTLACAVLSLACLGAAPAQADSPVTFVSGKGTDSGTCASPASPCRTFNFAINQTSFGGEIKALDPADYGPMFIVHSISITGVEGAGIDHAAPGGAIRISAEANDVVNLSHLTLNGHKIVDTGIKFNSGRSLTSAIAPCGILPILESALSRKRRPIF